jgi:chaperone modulatory protein CbpM
MTFTLRSFCHMIGRVEEGEIESFVAHGWLSARHEAEDLIFDEPALARARLILELRDELAIDIEAMPLVLNLLDQVYAARRSLRRLAEAVAAEPEDVRARIAAAFERAGGGAS